MNSDMLGMLWEKESANGTARGACSRPGWTQQAAEILEDLMRQPYARHFVAREESDQELAAVWADLACHDLRTLCEKVRACEMSSPKEIEKAVIHLVSMAKNCIENRMSEIYKDLDTLQSQFNALFKDMLVKYESGQLIRRFLAHLEVDVNQLVDSDRAEGVRQLVNGFIQSSNRTLNEMMEGKSQVGTTEGSPTGDIATRTETESSHAVSMPSGSPDEISVNDVSGDSLTAQHASSSPLELKEDDEFAPLIPSEVELGWRNLGGDTLNDNVMPSADIIGNEMAIKEEEIDDYTMPGWDGMIGEMEVKEEEDLNFDGIAGMVDSMGHSFNEQPMDLAMDQEQYEIYDNYNLESMVDDGEEVETEISGTDAPLMEDTCENAEAEASLSSPLMSTKAVKKEPMEKKPRKGGKKKGGKRVTPSSARVKMEDEEGREVDRKNIWMMSSFHAWYATQDELREKYLEMGRNARWHIKKNYFDPLSKEEKALWMEKGIDRSIPSVSRGGKAARGGGRGTTGRGRWAGAPGVGGRSGVAAVKMEAPSHPPGSLLCEICDDLQTDKGSYLLHLRSAHHQLQRANYSCTCCGDRFKTYDGFERHLLMAHASVTADLRAKAAKKEDAGWCRFCSKYHSFHLVEHVQTYHEVQLGPADVHFSCEMCEFKSASFASLEEHLSQAAHPKWGTPAAAAAPKPTSPIDTKMANSTVNAAKVTPTEKTTVVEETKDTVVYEESRENITQTLPN